MTLNVPHFSMLIGKYEKNMRKYERNMKKYEKKMMANFKLMEN